MKPSIEVTQTRRTLTEAEAKRILSANSIPTTLFYEVDSLDSALRSAELIGYPVVMKVHSSKVIHKTDAGGVILDIRNAEQLEQAFHQLMRLLKPVDPDGNVVVQEMITKGVELIVGVVTDPQFGPVMMVGAGGIFTELFEDVCFAMLPIREEDCWNMLRALKSYPLLTGFRGSDPVDLQSIVYIMKKVSQLVISNPDLLEIDLNPIIVNSQRAVVVDARFVVHGAAVG